MSDIESDSGCDDINFIRREILIIKIIKLEYLLKKIFSNFYYNNIFIKIL